jgi:hypothetical protein
MTPTGAPATGRRLGGRRAGLIRLLIAVAGLVVVVVVIVLIASGGGASSPPATGAASVVPAQALAYVDVSLDPRRSGVAQARRLGARLPGLPGLARELEGRLGALTGQSAGAFAAGARRWLGGEAALALLPAAGDRADSLLVFLVKSRSAADSFLSGGSSPDGTFDGASLHRFSSGAEAAVLGRYLVLGSPAGVRSAAQARSGTTPSLARSEAYGRAQAGLPSDRVLDLYAPAGGLMRLLADRGGFLGALGALLDLPGLNAVSLAVSAAPKGARLQLHSVFTSSAARNRSRIRTITPSLADDLPAGTAMLLDLPDLPGPAPRLLAAAVKAGIGGRVQTLLARLGSALRAEGVNVSALVALFDHEAAVAVTGPPSRPALLILARTGHPAAARVELAAAAPAIASLFSPSASGPGTAPLFGGRHVDGVDIHTLVLGTGLQLDYAVIDRLVAVSTGVQAIVSAARHPRTLASSSGYRAVLGGASEPTTSLVFLDLSRLIGLGEQTGLLRGASFDRLAPDLARIRAIGIRSTGGRQDSTAELSLTIP